MNVRRHFESLSEPNDTMYIEIADRHRFTRRGDDWVKFREDLIERGLASLSDCVGEVTKSGHFFT